MANINIIKDCLGVKRMVVDSTEIREDKKGRQIMITHVRPYKHDQNMCPYCFKKCPGYDSSKKESLWRTLDMGRLRSYLAYAPKRVVCKEHGVVSSYVPWSYPGSRFTVDFEMTVGWLTYSMNKKAISEYMGIAWNTVGEIISRVRKKLEPDPTKRYDNLVKIGVDETSYKKGHKYITTVVNLETNTVVWAHVNHGKAIFNKFFEELTDEQKKAIEIVAGDGAKWIDECIKDNLKENVVRCIDPFHVVTWAMEALDEVRRQAWNEARKEVDNQKSKVGRPKKGEEKKEDKAKEIKDSRYALGKNPENLTKCQQEKLEMIQITNKKLYRAYLLKEHLRLIFQMNDIEEVKEALDKWLSWAQRCRIIEFRELRLKIKRHYKAILSTMEKGISSAKVESLNNKIKLLIRRSYGFRNTRNMIDMIMINCSDIKIPLPNH